MSTKSTFTIYFLLSTRILINAQFSEVSKRLNTEHLNCTPRKSGYKCTWRNLSPASLNFCGPHNEICPTGWGCIDLHDGFLCRPHDIASFGHHHKPRAYQLVSRRKRTPELLVNGTKNKKNVCGEMLCQSGSVCQDGQCTCLMHSTGKYCEENVNYCSPNPCSHNITCLSRIGGFTCACTSNLAGPYCEIAVTHPIDVMKNPDFLFEPLQYVDFTYYYIFHTEAMGSQPSVEVDFGDGTVTERNHLVIHLTNAFTTLIQHFQPLLHIKSNQLEVYAFKHTYSKPNVYTVKVRAWNRNVEVYNTDYQIRAISARNCSLEVELLNAASDVKSVQRMHRDTAISIMSMSRSDCIQIELVYDWQLYKVESFESDTNVSNLFQIRKHQVDLHGASLDIPPFTLDYGSYVVVLVVKMLRPKLGVRRELRTWLNVLQRPIVAHIEGGNIVWVSSKAMFYLDASRSYDPNYGADEQPQMKFTWTCHPLGNFCMGYGLLDETGPVLLVPPNSLASKMHEFKVWVNYGKTREVSEFTGFAKQEVEVVDEVMPFFTIRCVRNCIGDYANSRYLIALRGICVYDVGNDPAYQINWVVYPDSFNHPDQGMSLDRTEYAADSSDMILYDYQLDSGQSYRFVFSGFNIEPDNWSGRPGNVSMAELNLVMYDTQLLERCEIFPTEGYAMLTTFTINCKDFVQEARNEMLYEVVQFNNLLNRSTSGALVGYDYTGLIRDITLSPGFRRDDYVTTLVISSTNDVGVVDSADLNVTVFPLIYYLKRPEDVMRRFIQVGTGLTSPLNTLLSGGNYLQVVQQIISTSFTLEHFLKSQDADVLHPELVSTSVDQVQDVLLSYLYQVPITSIQSLKHIACALNAVVNLPSRTTTWRITVFIAIDVLKKIIQALEDHIHRYKQIVHQTDMEDIGLLLARTASSLLKTPSINSHVLREDIRGSENFLLRERFLEQINPFNIDVKTLSDHDSSVALQVLDRFMHLFVTYKVPNERITLIGGFTLWMLVRKAPPEHLTVRSLSLAKRASVKFLFDQSLFHRNAFCNLEMVVMDDHPNWYENEDSAGFRFPFVKINVTNEVDGSPVDVDVEVDLFPVRVLPTEAINGSLPIRLFWQISEKDIQVHRIIVPKGGKLLLQFLPVVRNLKISVVVKRNLRPSISDFWYNGVIIPQRGQKLAHDQGLSLLVDDDPPQGNTFYYLGVLPHIDTLKELMKNVEEPVLPHAFHYDDEGHDERDSEDYYHEETTVDYNLSSQNTPKFIQPPKNISETTETNNLLLSYSFIAHSVACLTWNETKNHWVSNCNVKSTTSSSRVTCNCTGHDPLTVTFQKVSIKHHKYMELKYSISYHDNPLIPFLIIFTSILFIGLFKWAAGEDRNDRLRRTVCFLVDNYPQCEYCYLIIVNTGRLIKAGTTSNVTIELEGTRATSLPHVLRDWTRDVLGRGTQDWFVLKTTKPLGEIYCLHIWTDYSGSMPSWYCSKVVVHDIKEQQIWFFVVEKWFDPINGDGSLSYTIYQSTDDRIFSAAYQLRESVNREFDSGMHGWLSIFYKHPYNNYTRMQRVAVAYMHMFLLMVALVVLNDLPQADSPQHQIYKVGSYTWENRDLVLAFYAIIIAFPLQTLFVWLFRCTKPSSQWTESRLDRTLSRFNMDDGKSHDSVWIGGDSRPSSIQVEHRSKPIKNRVGFTSDFYEPEGDRQLRSKWSMAKLVKDAGSDKVVGLRTPTSRLETDADRDSVDSADAEVDVKSTIYGQEIVTQSYCFPPSFVYLIWILLVVVTVPCVYLVVFYGISYGWLLSLHFLTSFFLALLLSMTVFEPFKLVVWSIYLLFYTRQEYAIEDRSDLVSALDPEFTVPPSLKNTIINKINQLRESNMYKPLNAEQVHKVKRNRIASFLTRMIIADFMLLILFMLLLFSMLFNVFDPLVHSHYKGVKGLLKQTKASHSDALANVRTEKDLVDYLKNTLIANVQFGGIQDKEKFSLKSAADGVNYLVGVIRLRQVTIKVRKSRSACHTKFVKRWATRCTAYYDKKNFAEGWKMGKRHQAEEYSLPIAEKAWLYTRSQRRLIDSILHHNQTKYPVGGYTANLGQTKDDSLMKLNYLAKNKWFDFYTTVVYVEFALYNPHMHCLTFVTIMAERTEQGAYYLYDSIEVMEMDPMETHGHLFLLLFLLGLFLWLVWYIHKESRKYSLVMPKQVFSKGWDILKKLLFIFGIINLAIYTHKILNLDYYHEQIAKAGDETYIDFNFPMFWDDCLLLLIAFMLFLVILELSYIFRTFFKVNLAWTVVYRSLKAGWSFFLYLTLLILGFTWVGFVLYHNGSYNFQSFGASFFSIVGFTHKNFKVGQLGNTTAVLPLTFLYYVTMVVAIFFVFRWLMSVIMIHSYSSVKRNAHFDLYRPVISNYTKKYFNSIDSSPNRKPFKLSIYQQSVELRIRAVGYLFVDCCVRKMRRSMGRERELAMKAIATDVVKKKYKFAKQTHHDSILEEYRRKEQAKALTRTIISTNAFKSRLEYLGAKIDRLIRDERYRKLKEV